MSIKDLTLQWLRRQLDCWLPPSSCGDLCCLEPWMFFLKSHQLRRVAAMSVALGVSRSVAEWHGVPPVPPPPPAWRSSSPSLLSPERTDQLARLYSSTVHHHCSISRVVVSGTGRDAGRRKKTGSRRRIVLTEDLAAEDWRPGGWASSCIGPQSPGGQVVSSSTGPTWPPDPLDGRAWLVLVSSDPLDPRTPRASRPLLISWSRTEDWQQKKDRYQRRPGCGRSW